MAIVKDPAPWKAGIFGAIGAAALASATNIAINFATTEASLLRWSAVAILTGASGIAAGVAQRSRKIPRPEVRALDKPAVHLRITSISSTIDFKIYSEEVALQPGYIDQWIRTAHAVREPLDQGQEEGLRDNG